MSQRQKFLGLLGLVTLVILAVALVNVAKTTAQGPGDWPCTDDNDDTPQHGMMGGNNGMGHHGMMGDFDCESVSPMWEGMMRDHPMWNGSNENRGNQGMWDNMMMQAWTPPTDLIPTDIPFDINTASSIAAAYIAEWDDENLVLGEVMAFDNHFYATALESDTERGAFEFLIDPITGVIYTEPGPNMMWNLRYGQHAGMGYGMMGGFTAGVDGIAMTVSETQAAELAQDFLTDFNEDYAVASDDVEAFYGYYTLHITQNDEIVGMLSVNGYTGQVWLHHWHGQYIRMMSHQ
jgi:hypothetical protein